MKKNLTAILMFVMLFVMTPVFFSGTAEAATQTRYRRTRRGVVYKKPNFYRRHRKAVNIGAGTAAGAIVGGLIGGKKGAVIGGLGGAGAGAIVTHKQRPKNRVRIRRY